jgi:heme/copper-type cytochrome/quinol oxidase subunit 3
MGAGAVKRREDTPASVPAVRRGNALDVSVLPSFGFSHRSLMWWGNLGMVTIEGVAFAFLIIVYFYLRSLSNAWPDGGRAPDLLWGTINLVIILASAVPNYLAQRAAGGCSVGKVRLWLYVGCVLGVALCAVRWMEFTALNVRWDSGAYGSVVWILLGVHSFNLVTDVADTFVLTAVTYAQPVEGKRFVDIAENCGYWYFVVLSWLPVYAVVYFGARV